jgi:hypothetical protein
MQVAHDWNKSGNNYMTPSFWGATNITSITISQKSFLTGTMGDYFMYWYARGCSSLTSLDVPDTSSLESVGGSFMYSYAYGCSKLTSLAVPDTSGLTSVGNYFMQYYANGCSSLTSLAVPDTSGLTSVGSYFMGYYALGCSKLTSLAVPDTSGLTSVGSYFMYYYAYNCSSLTKLVLPAVGWFEDNNVNWGVPSGRLGVLKGRVLDPDDLSDWKALTVIGKTLYTNYIRDPDLVYYGEAMEFTQELVWRGDIDTMLVVLRTLITAFTLGRGRLRRITVFKRLQATLAHHSLARIAATKRLVAAVKQVPLLSKLPKVMFATVARLSATLAKAKKMFIYLQAALSWVATVDISDFFRPRITGAIRVVSELIGRIKSK